MKYFVCYPDGQKDPTFTYFESAEDAQNALEKSGIQGTRFIRSKNMYVGAPQFEECKEVQLADVDGNVWKLSTFNWGIRLQAYTPDDFKDLHKPGGHGIIEIYTNHTSGKRGHVRESNYIYIYEDKDKFEKLNIPTEDGFPLIGSFPNIIFNQDRLEREMW